jgi:imidazolonepropionase
MQQWDLLFINGNIATFQNNDYGLLEKSALAVSEGKIVWLGAMQELPVTAAQDAKQVVDLKGKLLTPGLIDCHTHVVYAGNRANEFEQRLNGVSYEEIAKAGGGIRSTVKAVREASKYELLAQSLPRVKSMLQQGVTTIEIKSGYGLDTVNEIKMLRVAKEISETLSVRVCPTFLGAHALPNEFQGQPDAYIDLICEETLPAVAEQRLATCVDAFCEGIGFSPEQVERVFARAKEFGLNVKLHAEQLSNLHGAALAAKYQALSADHLEYLDEAGVKAMKAAGTVAVLLPGAFYFLKETKKPPVDLLRQYGVPIALATDCNPGSSPTTSLPLMLNMACTLWQMTPLEALRAVTVNAARALGLQNEIGSLEIGKQADLAVWNCEHSSQLAYEFGGVLCERSYRSGC